MVATSDSFASRDYICLSPAAGSDTGEAVLAARVAEASAWGFPTGIYQLISFQSDPTRPTCDFQSDLQKELVLRTPILAKALSLSTRLTKLQCPSICTYCSSTGLLWQCMNHDWTMRKTCTDVGEEPT